MFSFSSIEQYHTGLKQGLYTCTQAVKHYLAAIRRQEHLNAFAEVFEEEALETARRLDTMPVTGALHGVVTGIKDNLCYAGHAAGAASRILQGFTAPYSATAVQRLVEAGAIIIGRQNCDEFGMGSTNENSCYGPVLNPVNSAHVAGGSSGGSAAAVGAGLCMAALGTDTGGSVRLPASFCGVVGFKPGYGSVSRHGLIAYASSFDQVGILATRVDDVSRIYNVISGNDAFDGTCNTVAAPVAVQRPRIAWFPEWIEHPSVDPEIAAAMKQHLLELESRGFEVVPVSFPLTDYIVPAYYVLTTAEASSNLARFDGVRFGSAGPAEGKDLASFYKANRTAGFGKEVRRRIMLGTFVLSAGYFDAYYTKAQQVRAMLIRHMDALFAEYQFIIAPTSPTVAYKIQDNSLDQLALYMGDIFTVYASLVGIPAISLPVFKHSCNLPFGLQVLSSPHNEVSLQRFSHQLMLQ